MMYVLAAVLGFVAGSILIFVLLESKRKAVEAREEAQSKQARDLRQIDRLLEEKQRELDRVSQRAVTYAELESENQELKCDLRNVVVQVRKLELDRDQQRSRQDELDEKSRQLAARYLKDQIKWISGSLTPNNFATCKEQLVKAIQRCREIGFELPSEEETSLVADLKAEYERIVRAAFVREEQARIKARIREEQRLEREVDREVKQLDRERAAIQAALDKALREAKDAHGAEIEALRARLAEAEAKSQRALSQAQMTKSGHVYVISNIGSFGDGVFKIGMTRRLEPADRIRELGDASVPFPFDVHMMISSDDAPTLENALHRELHRMRLNKANPRKEFFRAGIERIAEIVRANHGEVEYVVDAEALEYRQSMEMSEEDVEFIEDVYDRLEDDGEADDDE